MTGPEYRQALTTLNLTNDQAAIWLGVGRSTAYRYATKGPSGPAARAVRMAGLTSELLTSCWELRLRLAAFVGAVADITDCGPDVEAIKRADLVIEKARGAV